MELVGTWNGLYYWLVAMFMLGLIIGQGIARGK